MRMLWAVAWALIGLVECWPSRIFATVHRGPSLRSQDNEVFDIINHEHLRQRNGLELIASENFVSTAVQQALSSCLTNKYSEGYPNARYYGGNKHIDEIELLCQQRALSLFGLDAEEWGVNVQSYSGSIANLAAISAVIQPHESLMGLDLPSGGHLSHGYQTTKRKVSAVSAYYACRSYRVHPATGLIDYDDLERIAAQHKPKLIIAGASAYPRDWDYARMRTIADSCGALLLADISHIAGLVVTGHSASPFPYCDLVTTTTHKTLRGPRSALIFSKREFSGCINAAVFPGLQGGPHNHQIAAVAVALREAAMPQFREYIAQVVANAVAMADELRQLGHTLATNGTDTHMLLWDVRRTGCTGAQIEKLLDRCGVSVNKNMLPSDLSAWRPGGLRIGTPAMTSRGMMEDDARSVARLLHEVMAIGQKVKIEGGEEEQTNLRHFLAAAEAQHGAALQRLSEQVVQFVARMPFPTTSYLGLNT